MRRTSAILLVLVVLAGTASAAESRFIDVPADHVFAEQIEWLADQGITRGCNPPANDRFCPDQSVTRGQMAAFLVRALGLSEVDPELPEFVDVENSMFLGDIMKLATAGVTRGCNPPANDRFCPDQVVTRGQMAAFLNRAIPAAFRVDVSGVPGGTVGVDYTAELTVAGGWPPLTWHSTGLPDGLSLTNGVLAGVPTAAGEFEALIRVTDSGGNDVTAGVHIDIDQPLVIETSELPAWIVGEARSFDLLASGGESPYAWSGSGLPAGLSISAAGEITGAAGDLGDHAIGVVVIDGDGRAANATLQLRVVNPFHVVTTTAADGTVGVAYDDTLELSGGEPPYVWSAVGLPDGLILSSAGVLSGTPTLAGSHRFDATVTDGRSDTASATVTLAVYEPLVVSTSSLPAATRGEAYWTLLSAAGGKPPHTWSGAMPPGLSLSSDGVISGTPTATSDFGVTIQVTDAGGRTDQGHFNINVAEPVEITTSSLPDGTVADTYDLTLTATGGEGPYTWDGSMPPGLSLSTDGTLFGYPTEAGAFGITFYATDQEGRSASRYLTVDVYDPMSVTTPSLSGTVGVEYSDALPASGGKPPYTWEADLIPTGFVLGPDGSLAGTPTAAGDFDFEITVRDSGGRSVLMDLTIDVDDPLSIPHEAMPDGWLYVPYDFTLSAEGGEAPFTWDRGEIPDGMGMYSYGEFVGAPLWGGYWDVPFTVTDADGRVAQKTLPLFVAGAKRVNVSYELEQANDGVWAASMSGDGRYVVYATPADNLLEGDTDADADVYVYDEYSQKVTRASVAADGSEVTGECHHPDVDYDGDMIVFTSDSLHLIPSGGTGNRDVYLRDVGAATTRRLSESATGEPGDGDSSYARISDDGRYVVFWSEATNLVPNDTNGVADIFVKDTLTGNVIRVSVASDGTEANDISSGSADISGDGRWVVFYTAASNLVPGDTNGVADVFLHDLLSGTTTLVSQGYDGSPLTHYASLPTITSDGSKVAYMTESGNVVSGDTNGTSDVFVFDRHTGSTERVSYQHDGSELDEDVGGRPHISGNGQVLTYRTRADGVVAADTDGTEDTFAVDLSDGDATMLSVGAYGANANQTGAPFGITDDGVFVLFVSTASNLVPGDTNSERDIFMAAVDLR